MNSVLRRLLVLVMLAIWTFLAGMYLTARRSGPAPAETSPAESPASPAPDASAPQ